MSRLMKMLVVLLVLIVIAVVVNLVLGSQSNEIAIDNPQGADMLRSLQGGPGAMPGTPPMPAPATPDGAAVAPETSDESAGAAETSTSETPAPAEPATAEPAAPVAAEGQPTS